jgi:predicted RND superfamily exporter protein
MLTGLHHFEQALAADPEVGAALGLASVVRLMRYAADGTDAWPDDEDALEDLAGTLEMVMMQRPEMVRGFVDRSGSQTQITVLSHATEHEGYQRLHGRIDHHWQEAVESHPALAGLELRIVGLGPLQAKMSQSLVPTLVESFAITAAIIFVTFLIVFRSGAARIMTMVPSLFAILVMFLTLRCVGLGLNIATILIATTVLGTSENDQIHFFYHYLEGKKDSTVSKALSHTFLISGRAIFFATIINAGGFIAFAVGELRPMAQFGTFTALALLLSMLADFTALPAALWILSRERPEPAAQP